MNQPITRPEPQGQLRPAPVRAVSQREPVMCVTRLLCVLQPDKVVEERVEPGKDKWRKKLSAVGVAMLVNGALVALPLCFVVL